MKPILYKTDTDFSQTGLGVISDAILSDNSIVEKFNGEYTLTFDVPVSSKYYELIKPEMFIKINSSQQHDWDIFWIKSTDVKSNPNIMTVNCNHYSMLSNDAYARGELSIDGKTPGQILSEMQSMLDLPHHGFVFSSTVNTTIKDTGVIYTNSNPNAILVGESNSLCQIVDGRIERWYNQINLAPKQSSNIVNVRKGKNIAGLTINRSFEGKVTQMVPYFKMKDAKDTPDSVTHVPENHLQYGQAVNSKYFDNYSRVYRKYVDYSDRVDNLIDMDDLSAKYFEENPGIDIPDYVVSINISEYGSKRMQRINIGDLARIHDPDFNLDIELPIVEREFNPLKNTNTTIKAGTQPANLFRKLEKRIKDETDNRKAADDKSDEKLQEETDNRIAGDTHLSDEQKQRDLQWKMKAAEFQKKIDDARADMTNFMNSGGTNVIRWIPTLAEATQMEIHTDYGYLLIDDHGVGFHAKDGTVMTGMDARGNFIANNIYGNVLNGTTINSGTLNSVIVNAGQINATDINGSNIRGGYIEGVKIRGDTNIDMQGVHISSYGISTPALTVDGQINGVYALGMLRDAWIWIGDYKITAQGNSLYYGGRKLAFA